eukprot:TRINITY_DN757_c0_g1_i8.p2 TRINITY_DN757_c0_g1~~TRINITY_DN757_c0_g1_i8.p2  ORF type:complete len:292 (+),score=136.20 TRINITY_DN757_c0_g1_i8:123-998(+)
MPVDPVFLILGLVGLLAAGFILSRVLGGAKPAAAADTAEKVVDEAPKPAKAPPPKPAKVAKAPTPEFETATVLRGFSSRLAAVAATPLGDMAAAAGECRTLRIAWAGDAVGPGAPPFSQAAGAKAFAVPGLPLDDISALAWDSGEAGDRRPGDTILLAVAFADARSVAIFSVTFDTGTGRFTVKERKTIAATGHKGPIASLCLSTSTSASRNAAGLPGASKDVLLTAGSATDLVVRAFSPATGAPLGAFSTTNGEVNAAAAPGSGRFWAIGGFTPDVVVLEAGGAHPSFFL